MLDSWLWWVLAGAIGLYGVVLLLDFNRPARQLTHQLARLQLRVQELGRRQERLSREEANLRRELAELDQRLQEREARRQQILPEANARSMVRIPGGAFCMGGRQADSPRQELPAHTVHLPDYYIGRYPVTNLDYRQFVLCTGHRQPSHWQRNSFPAGRGTHPVVNVSWGDAVAYAAWRGVRLPTEAEWEMAARGADERLYPWGDRFAQECCNGAGHVGTTTAVDEFPAGCSPYGVWDMSGNVAEWCADYYDPDYYGAAPPADPTGPETGYTRVLRGGCFVDTRIGLRVTARTGLDPVALRDNVGFRVAMDAHAAPVAGGT